MTKRSAGPSPLVSARIAGFLGLVILISGSCAGFVHTRLVVPQDAATTAKNIMASQSLFRLGVLSGIVMYTVFIPYVLTLYRLLKPVNKYTALSMLLFAMAGVPIALLNQGHQAATLELVSGSAYLKAFSQDQIYAQMMMLLKLHAQGNLIAVIFWGLWLFPLGFLIFKSGYFPKILGILLMIGCFGWLMVFVQRFFFPNYEALSYARYAAHIAELSLILWLLIKGVNVESWQKRVMESAS